MRYQALAAVAFLGLSSLAVAASAPETKGAAAEGVTGQNSFALLKAAQTSYAKGNLPAAASLSNLAMMRNRVDHMCFPPAEHSTADDFDYAEAELGDKLRAATLADPSILEHMVSDAQAWAPDAAAGYDPGWQAASRCPDYSGLIKEVKTQMLPVMQRAATLLRIPEYRQAFLTFSDVMQDYESPPADDAYSPARVAGLAEAVRTMQEIESKQGLPYFGQMAAMDTSKPVAFHVLASGQAEHQISYDDPNAPVQLSHLILDEGSLAKLWHAVYGDTTSSPPVPAVDFNKQMVVAMMEQGRSVKASRMFVSRIEAGDKPFPSLTIYVRIPVLRDGCFAHPATVYPYALAVIDRPASLPTSTGFDEQNFPVFGCPDK